MLGCFSFYLMLRVAYLSGLYLYHTPGLCCSSRLMLAIYFPHVVHCHIVVHSLYWKVTVINFCGDLAITGVAQPLHRGLVP